MLPKAGSTAVMALAVLGAAFGMQVPAAHAAGAFDGYAGSWSGGGTIQIADAGTERIRCRGTYSTDGSGNNLRQSLRCASDSYRFDLTTDIRSNGSSVSGFWSESSRGINGTVDGRVSSGNVVARVETNGYVASFNITTRNGKQSVAIASPGPIRAVNISLTRGN
ncbi:MAG: hypothetical protein EKK40_03960 [Bradyrhizobiaceae bacterium]|nr:MAG: hypothetical protein EKK40_03960 [Bradyrhizobiaceae bacterium]